MSKKPKGPKSLVTEAKNIELRNKRKRKYGIAEYSNFEDAQKMFEGYIMDGLSEKHSAILAGLHPQTIEKHKQRYPEYKERLLMLKGNMPAVIKAKYNTILKTGGDLSPSDYVKALQWSLERNPETKAEHSKTAHILQETISRTIDEDTKSKIMEVFQEEIEDAEIVEEDQED